MKTPASFGGLRLAPLTTRETVRWILDAAAARRGCVVVTSNIHHLRLAQEDTTFRDVLERAELNVADGWPLVAATRLSAVRVPERVAGIDLVDALLRQVEVPLRVAVLGGPPRAAAALAAKIDRPHEVVYVDALEKGVWDQPGWAARLATELGRAEPTLTLVGIGAPRQELLADELRPVIAGPAIGCGAAIEVLAGVTPRAPAAVQAVHLEWAFRLVREPRRLFPRYFAAGRAFVRTLAQEAKARRRRSA